MSYPDYHNPPLKCEICGNTYHWGRGMNVHKSFHEHKIIDNQGKATKKQILKSIMGRRGYKGNMKVIEISKIKKVLCFLGIHHHVKGKKYGQFKCIRCSHVCWDNLFMVTIP